MTTALIDGDIVAYRCAASAEESDEDVAFFRADEMIRNILIDTGCDEYINVLSGGKNFRYNVYPEYKGNRADMKKPKHLAAIRQHLMQEHGSYMTNGLEADDILGMWQNDDTVICTLDKDLMQIPGQHWNFVKRTWATVTFLEGKRWFWTQMLSGGKADHIPGFDGKFRAKVPNFITKVVAKAETNEEMFELVWPFYKDAFDQFIVNGMCLYILQEEKHLWLDELLNWTLPDQLKQKVGQTYESMKSLMSDTVTAHTTTTARTFGGPANGTVTAITPTLIVPLILEIPNEGVDEWASK